MKQRFDYYWKLWCCFLTLSLRTAFSKNIDGGSYWLGKFVRLGFFILMMISIFHHSRDFLGYTLPEMVLIFLTFNLIDSLSQVAFRGLYGLGKEVNRGLFDFILIRPANALFLSMARTVDILDVILLLPIVGAYLLLLQYIDVTFWNGLAFAGFLLISIIIVTAFHILMAAAIILMGDDNILMVFRSLGRFAMFPQETYSTVVRYLLIFGLPIFTMMIFPGQALIGKLDVRWLLVATVVAVVFWGLSLVVWKQAVQQYSSASS